VEKDEYDNGKKELQIGKILVTKMKHVEYGKKIPHLLQFMNIEMKNSKPFFIPRNVHIAAKAVNSSSSLYLIIAKLKLKAARALC